MRFSQSWGISARQSNWSLKEMINVTVNINRYVPLSAGMSTFPRIPALIRDKRVVVNIENVDNFCYLWWVTAVLHQANRLWKFNEILSSFYYGIIVWWYEIPYLLTRRSKVGETNQLLINVYDIKHDSVTKKELQFTYCLFDYLNVVGTLTFESFIHSSQSLIHFSRVPKWISSLLGRYFRPKLSNFENYQNLEEKKLRVLENVVNVSGSRQKESQIILMAFLISMQIEKVICLLTLKKFSKNRSRKIVFLIDWGILIETFTKYYNTLRNCRKEIHELYQNSESVSIVNIKKNIFSNF